MVTLQTRIPKRSLERKWSALQFCGKSLTLLLVSAFSPHFPVGIGKVLAAWFNKDQMNFGSVFFFYFVAKENSFFAGSTVLENLDLKSNTSNCRTSFP